MSTIAKPPCDEAIIQSKASTTPCARKNELWILAATILGSSIAFIDGTVINVALPVLQKDLQVTVADVQWVVESYSLFLAALILVGGSLGDIYGRRRLFALGIFLFSTASIWCGLSPNVSQLILARAVQGIGGALLVPGSLAIISASFNEERRGRAIGTWSGFTAITAAIGPVLGGWLVQYGSWRWAFFINVPLAAIVLFLLFWRVPESSDEKGAAYLDWQGALLATVGLGFLVYGLIGAGQVGFSNLLVLGSLAIGIVVLFVFVWFESRTASPMLPLTLFRSRNFSGANMLTFLLYAALGGALFFVPFNLIQVQGYSASAAGAAMLPFIFIMFLLSRWSGGLVNRYGAKLPLVIGPTIAATGFALFAIPGIGNGTSSYWTTYFPAVVVLGTGMAISVAPLTTVVMSVIDTHHAGTASGVNNAVSRTASVLTIAALGIVMVSIFSRSLDNHLTTLKTAPDVRQLIDAQRVKLGGIELPPTLSHQMRIFLEQAIDDAFVTGFRVVMLTSAGLALASGISAWLIIENKK